MSGGTPVTCERCGHENRAGARFCGGCGGELGLRCSSCGSVNPVADRFCEACGARLDASEGVPAAGPAAAAAGPGIEGPAAAAPPEHLSRKIRAGAASLAGERKQVTVLFADVMGSMDLAERTDPERWRAIMDRFFALLAEAVHRFEGTVDKFTGDGIMALFGAPIAHEDHARRACYAALEMERSIGEYAGELRRSDGISLTLRIGINSGEVVVGSIGDDLSLSYTAVGHTVGLAQRMESLAEPGRAYLTEHAAKLVEGYVDLRDLGEFDVKGSSRPLRVHELGGVGTARGRIDVSRRRGLSPFVGRGDELAELEAALERAIAGDGSAVGIVAEAGIGKSRLCHEFVERCRTRGIDVYEAQCQAHTRNLPLMPVLQMLRAYFGIEPDDSERDAREKIAGRLLLLEPGFGDDLGLVFDFLAVSDPERPAPQMNPEARQRRLIELVRRIVQARGRQDAAVNVVEDLHWIDPASDVFLAALIDAVPGTGTLVVANFRPEYRGEWTSRSYYRQIPLAPLGPEALGELLGELLGEDPSLDGLAELIRERTGGNPFFVEEVVRELAESGALEGERGSYSLVREVDELAVPAEVQAILAARIDRLGADAKASLQAAAAIGGDFRLDLLSRAVEPDEHRLGEAMRELVEAEFVYETALYPQPEYAFRHPLTREVAYGSQLAAARARTHAAIARGIEELDPDRADENAALVAHHYEEAGEALDAARWHARAAGWASFNDPAAAFGHWQRVRELDSELPEGEEGDAMRSTARLMIVSMGWRLGADVGDQRQVFAEGKEIAERRGDAAALALLHGGLGITVGTCEGNVAEYLALSEEADRIGTRIDDPNARTVVAALPMYAYYLAGRHEEALASLDLVIELTADDPQLGAGVVVTNPRAWATSFRSAPLMALGRCAEARRAADEGAELCRRWDRESLGWTHTFYCGLAFWGAGPEPAEAVAHGRQAVEIAETIGDAFSRTVASYWHGTAQATAGQYEDAVASFGRALELIAERGAGREFEPQARGGLCAALAALGDRQRAIEEGRLGVELGKQRGVRAGLPAVLRQFAEALLDGGCDDDLEHAAALLDESEALAREVRQLPDVAWTLRARARLLAARGDDAGSERALVEALTIARDVGATRLVREVERESGSEAARS